MADEGYDIQRNTKGEWIHTMCQEKMELRPRVFFLMGKFWSGLVCPKCGSLWQAEEGLPKVNSPPKREDFVKQTLHIIDEYQPKEGECKK